MEEELECPKSPGNRHCWRTSGSYGHAHNDCQECHGCGASREYAGSLAQAVDQAPAFHFDADEPKPGQRWRDDKNIYVLTKRGWIEKPAWCHLCLNAPLTCLECGDPFWEEPNLHRHKDHLCIGRSGDNILAQQPRS